MAQQVRTAAVLVVDKSLIPSTHNATHRCSYGLHSEFKDSQEVKDPVSKKGKRKFYVFS